MKARDSLVCDLMEAARPKIDDRRIAKRGSGAPAFIASGFSLSRGAEGDFDHLIFTQVAGSVEFGPRNIVALQRRARRGVQKLQSGEMWELPARLRYKLSWDADRLSALEPSRPLVRALL